MKMTPTTLIFSVLAIFQLVLAPFSISMMISYTTYATLAIMTFLIIPLVFLLYLMNRSKKYKPKNIRQFWKEILLENSIFFIGMIVGLMFILFSSNVKDHDATYYISLSSNFRNSIFSPNGIELTPVQYRAPAMFYTYSVFFQNSLTESYYLLNPIIYLCIAVDLTKQVVKTFNIRSKKIMYLIEFFTIIGVALICSSSLGFVVGMNILPQSLVIIYAILIFYKNEENMDVKYFSLIGVSFFSATGTLILLPLSLGIFAYLFLSRGMKYSTKFLYLPALISLYYVFSFIERGHSLTSLLILLISLLIPVVWLWIHAKFIYKKPDTFVLLNKLESSKYYIWSSSIIFLAIGIFTFAYWTFIYKSNYYFQELGYLSLFFYLSLIMFNIYYLKKDHSNTNTSIILLIFIVAFIASIESVIINSLPTFSSNQSIWRLNFLVLGFNSVNDIVLLIMFLIAWIVNAFKKTKFEKSKFLDWLVVGISLLVSTAGAVNLGQAHNAIFKNAGRSDSTTYLSLNKNIQNNLYKLPYSDINMLSNLVKNFDTTYISDGPYSSYINMGIDVTNYMTSSQGKYLPSNQSWNYNNFNFGLDNWNASYPDKQLTIDGLQIHLKDFIKSGFSDLKLQSMKTKKILTSLDYIILQNDTDYFASWSKYITTEIIGWEAIKSGNQITVFQPKTKLINYV